MKILIVSGVLLSALIASAQSEDLKQRVLTAQAISHENMKLSAQKVALEQAIFEGTYKMSNLMTVGEVLNAASKATLPRGCTVSFDGKKLHVKNENGALWSFDVYGPDAKAELAGFGNNPGLKATATLDLSSYEKRSVLVFFDAEGNVSELYAEQYYQDHGTRFEYQARCWLPR